MYLLDTGLPKRFSMTIIEDGAVVVSREFLNRANVFSRPLMRCSFRFKMRKLTGTYCPNRFLHTHSSVCCLHWLLQRRKSATHELTSMKRQVSNAKVKRFPNRGIV